MDLKGFAKEVCGVAFEGGDLSGFEIQEIGVKFGVLKKVAFDPLRHKDPEGFCEPGDWWYQFPEELNKI